MSSSNIYAHVTTTAYGQALQQPLASKFSMSQIIAIL